MNSNKCNIIAVLFMITAAAVSIFGAMEARNRDLRARVHWPGELRGVLEINSMADTSASLIVGYNYYLLEKYASERDQQIEIILAERDVSYLDSLRAGKVDIVVFPYGLDANTDSLVTSTPIDSSSVWMMSGSRQSILKDVNGWIDDWHASEEYQSTRDSFLKRFNIFRTGKRESLSPYDNLIKEYSDSAGCDWRLLAAIIYKESRFHIEAKSKRGARGLMQMMPHTARHYGAHDPLDPRSNISAGAEHLVKLIKRYSRVGANKAETYKLALAAYNAGVGRIDDCINYARYRDVDPSYWENIVEIIPEMSADDIMEKGILKVGPFKGVETIAYVETVINIYNRMHAICPD